MTHSAATPAFHLLAVMAVTAAALPAPVPPVEHRPPLDKTAYLKTVWSAANPWWLPNKSRTHGRGGPDFAWHKYSDDPVTMWQQVAERCKRYGLTGLQFELIARNAGYVERFMDMLEGFSRAGNGMMAQVFLTGGADDVATATENYLATFGKLMPAISEHPNVYRLNGAPVVVVYTPAGLKPGEWRQVMDAVENEHGRMVWLANAAHAKPAWLREQLPHWDGISMYANWSEEGQIKLYDWLAGVMHDEFPHKIFEGAVHTTYCVHFHYGGPDPRLTRKYRNSWDITLNARPDSVTITNWFDTYENSRIMPSYELEDSMLRVAQHRIALWQGEEPERTAEPDLYVANYVSRILGQPLHLEVIGFPLAGEERTVGIALDLCDAREEVLHCFDPIDLVLEGMATAEFELPSEDLTSHRAVFPRLSWTFRGREQRTVLLPPTHLVTSLRPHMLFRVRSVKRLIRIDTSREWTLNGRGAGETVQWPADGCGVVTSRAFSQGVRDVENRGGGWVRILRNGRELESFANWDLAFTRLLRLPDPGAALDWYALELENRYGCRYLSPPLWVSSGTRPGTVSLPILLADDTVRDVEVEAVRVPFFQYDCERDTGAVLYDCSGYDHHGRLGGKGYGGGHLGFTGYRHEHTGHVAPDLTDACPHRGRDEDGKGFLAFDGTNYVMIQGGTAFPYASTFELLMRPRATGARQGVLGAANGQVHLFLTENGTLEAVRAAAGEPLPDGNPRRVSVKAASKTAIGPDCWTHVAVVYDLRTLTLFVDGKAEDAVPAAPLRSHEKINALVLGGACKFPYTPVPGYVGDLRRVRVYGRDLRPNEFLR